MTTSTAERAALLDRYASSGFDAVVVALEGASEADLDRHGQTGWSARQVVHHLADSETMAATRVRRLVGDDDPVTIQGYDEPGWARAPLRPADRRLARPRRGGPCREPRAAGAA